ncbi:ABC transporter permease [Cellulosilyticum ruminicola]|uniref:ABC transporter permease n=1 Tax=Cellulosilyticum ruminicola TaxID=425254 RepID=UPI0006D201AB|nr:ABC transporter permease [Cellulosilyticum ruminicola]
MGTVRNLVKRNILLYIRDRSAVFFSLLSMMIVILLMVAFLGESNSKNIVDVLKQYGTNRNYELDKANALYFIQTWTLAGILVVNAVTVTVMMIGFMVRDEEENKLNSFYVAPVSRIKIAMGYVISALVVGTIMCSITLAIGEVYIKLGGGELLTLGDTLRTIGLIVVNVFASACIMFLVALFVHSNSAWSGLNTVISTLVGFAGGIYLSMGMLPEGVQSVLKCLPVLHGTAMLRVVCTRKAIEKTFEGMPVEVIEECKKAMGITIQVGNHKANTLWQIAFIIGCGIIALILSILIIRKNKVYEG